MIDAELAIEYLDELKEKYIEGEGYEKHPLPEYYAIEDGIEALHNFLEEVSLLGKIRAEIIEMRSKQNVGVLECLDIIDKYKADKKNCTTCIGFGDKDYAQSFCHDCIKDIQNHYKTESEE